MDIYFNRSLIEGSSAKALLIKLPKEKVFFWFPKSLVSLKGSKGSWIKLFVPDDFKISLKRGNGDLIREIDNETLYKKVESMSDTIEGSLSASKEKKINSFISNKVKLENPKSTLDMNLVDE